MQLPQDFRKDLPKNVSCSNQSCFLCPFCCCCCYCYHYVSSFPLPMYFFWFIYVIYTVNPLELLLSVSALVIINIERKVPNLFLSPPQPEDVRQMLNSFPPLTDSSTLVFWKFCGGGIKILILSAEDDLVWKDPDFNVGSLDENVSKRGLHAQSSLRSHCLLFLRRSPLGEWTAPNRWTFGPC